MGYGGGGGVWGGLHGGCLWLVVLLPRACVGRVQGVPETMQECALRPPPPLVTVARDCGQCLPLFVCPPPPPRGDRVLSACLVLSPPNQGEDVCNYRLRALVSATLWALLPFWHCLMSGTPKSELHELS